MNCYKCGSPIPEGQQCCENCGFPVKEKQKKDNMLTGTVGAFLGALIGAACIILLSQLGYIASISGLVLAVCTLKGYELLGGRLSGRGIAVCVFLMLVTPYIADRIDWAIILMQEWAEYGATFGECYALFPELLLDGSIEVGAYIKNLLMIYGFTLLGAFTTVRNAVKK